MRVSSRVRQGVPPDEVVAYLARRFSYLDTEVWQQLVQDGRVWVNGRLADPATPIRPGDTITCDMPDFAPPPVNLAYEIIYEDAWLLGINKPPGLRVHSQGKFVQANLMYHLRHVRQPAYPEVMLVNRLDANTSGVVLVARSTAVKRALDEQFAAGTVAKRYLGVVMGCPDPPVGSIDLPVGHVAGSRLRIRHGVVADGKTAVTHYQTLAAVPPFCLLALQPQTGRTHQLRVHLAAIGHPLVGDALYALDDEAYLNWLEKPQPIPPPHGLTRQALHCWETRFWHPITGQPCTITASLPADMAALLPAIPIPH